VLSTAVVRWALSLTTATDDGPFVVLLLLYIFFFERYYYYIYISKVSRYTHVCEFCLVEGSGYEKQVTNNSTPLIQNKC
jgi:hypothetical protein